MIRILEDIEEIQADDEVYLTYVNKEETIEPLCKLGIVVRTCVNGSDMDWDPLAPSKQRNLLFLYGTAEYDEGHCNERRIRWRNIHYRQGIFLQENTLRENLKPYQ